MTTASSADNGFVAASPFGLIGGQDASRSKALVFVTLPLSVVSFPSEIVFASCALLSHLFETNIVSGNANVVLCNVTVSLLSDAHWLGFAAHTGLGDKTL